MRVPGHDDAHACRVRLDVEIVEMSWMDIDEYAPYADDFRLGQMRRPSRRIIVASHRCQRRKRREFIQYLR